jgi:hypothetical protein
VKHSPRPSRTPANLSQSVHHRINMYAIAAGAVGVGALALSQPSQAKIVYTPAQVTPAVLRDLAPKPASLGVLAIGSHALSNLSAESAGATP